MIKIEKNIPIPSSSPKSSKYQFYEMEVGESFCCSIEFEKSLRTQSYNFGTKVKRKFSVRKTNDGIRVWRIK